MPLAWCGIYHQIEDKIQLQRLIHVRYLSLLILKFIRITHISDSHEIVNNWAALLGSFSGCSVEVEACIFSGADGKTGNENWFTKQWYWIGTNPRTQKAPTLCHPCTNLSMGGSTMLEICLLHLGQLCTSNTHACFLTLTHTRTYRHTHSPTTHPVFIFEAWVTGISFRPARSPFAQFGLAGVPLLVIKPNLS